MLELSTERVDEILHKETQKTEELPTILRGIYTRYMHLCEEYLADLDALNDDKIAELKKYHEETRSLVKYYYMDIPEDICTAIREYDEQTCTGLLGPDWRKYVVGGYEKFKEDYRNRDKSEECLKKEFKEQNLKAFYEEMDDVFRDGFGTASKRSESITNWLSGLLFGQQQQK
ncbi:MAG: hypothetical protein IKS55_05445 [Oscillospiraceae bacterium]|nr:hypothetical protein [Oscillospiraceae bacterium]